MDVRTEEAISAADSADPRDEVIPEIAPPGLQQSLVLAMDSFLTLIRLFKSEAAQALSALPMFAALNIARLPVYLLTWISFVTLVATAVYSLTTSWVLAACAFFVLQLGLAWLLEHTLRKVRETCSLSETRKSAALVVAGLRERFQDISGGALKDEQSNP